MDPKDAKSLNPRAIFSKTGKGVHEASGKTSHLSRADRAVLAAIDGKTPLSDISAKFDKLSADKFDALIQLLDKDGFVREVSSGQSVAPSPRPAAPAAKAPPKAPPSADEGDDMDFTQAIKILPKGSAPAAPKPPSMDLAAAARAEAERKLKDQELDYKGRQETELKARAAAEAKTKAEADAKVKAAREAAVRMATEVKAKAEAEAKVKAEAAEREKARIEAELNAKLEAEHKAREDAERRAAEAAELARKELEGKAKRDAEELRQRLEAEMKAKLDAERKVREEEDRKRREEEDRKRKEEDERRRKEEDERRAKEDAERKAREEADRKKREEEDRKRRDEDARRAKDEAERRTKEEAEKRSREETDRKKRDEEDRKRREEDDRRRKEEDARRAKEDAERKGRDEAEARARAAASASLPAIEPAAPPSPPPAAPAGVSALGDDLLADLDSFGKREEEELKAKEEAERQAKEAAARKAKEAKEVAERKAREEAEAKRRDEEERRRKADEELRAQEEAERKAREEEEERHKQEEAERQRKAKDALAAKQAAMSAAKGGDDVDVRDEDLDMDEIKRDHKVLAKGAAAREPVSAVVAATGRPKRWGKPVAIAVFALLVVGIGVLHVLPVSTADYEKGASEALGVPVKIGSARMSVITGVELKFENVAIGDSAKVHLVRGSPDIGSLFGGRKSFSRVELEGVSMGQSQIADALLGKAAGANFRIGRVTIKQLSLDGPLKLPPLDVDASVAGDGTFQEVKLAGPDKLSVTLLPKGGDISFKITAPSFAPPFVPALNMSEFEMEGTANRSGVVSSKFEGRAFDGVIKGTARIRWGGTWSVDGTLSGRSMKIAVFAPTLVSEGKVEGEGKFAMSGADAGKLYEGARLEGNIRIENGVIGNFNLRRALETGGAQTGGRTEFAEMTGQGVYERGAVQLRNLAFSAGAMNANASIDIDANGGISGRIAADVKTPNQILRANLNVSGKVQDPVIRK